MPMFLSLSSMLRHDVVMFASPGFWLWRILRLPRLRSSQRVAPLPESRPFVHLVAVAFLLRMPPRWTNLVLNVRAICALSV